MFGKIKPRQTCASLRIQLGGVTTRQLHLRNIKHFFISTQVEIGKMRNCVETRRPQGGENRRVTGNFPC